MIVRRSLFSGLGGGLLEDGLVESPKLAERLRVCVHLPLVGGEALGLAENHTRRKYQGNAKS